MQPVRQELFMRIGEWVPQGSEIIPLDWAYEDEDHTIAVFIDDHEHARLAEERLLDTISDYDEAYGTLTLCLVWHNEIKQSPGCDEEAQWEQSRRHPACFHPCQASHLTTPATSRRTHRCAEDQAVILIDSPLCNLRFERLPCRNTGGAAEADRHGIGGISTTP